MRALLLAAGIGSRLRPITDTVPKCLVPIHGKPLLGYWLDRLLGGGVDQVLVNTHYLAPQVDAFVAASAWRDKVTLVYEEELLGTGGTMLANHTFLANDAFLVAHADNLTTFNLSKFMQAHKSRPADCAMTMLSFRTDDPRSCGILEMNTAHVVQAFHEKVENPPGNVANAAVYIFEPEVLDFIAALGKSTVDLSTEVIPHFVGRIFVVENNGYHRDIGNVESLRLAHLEFPDPAV
tara:strand:+ start:8926 stop:9633 length:708 start_codon:yes stop_codon:yes gene_type:complete